MVCSKFVHSGCSVKLGRSNGEPEGNKKAIRNEVQKSNV